MSFAPSQSSPVHRAPADREPPPGFGRATIVAHVDGWLAGATPDARAALVVIDVDLDDALPVDAPTADGDEDALVDLDAQRRARRLGRSVERAVRAQVRSGDEVSRIDAGRFAVLRGTLPDGSCARREAEALARGVEDGLLGRSEGFGARVTVGAATLRPRAARDGRATLGLVTSVMLEGKLFTDDRVVVAVAACG